MLLARFRERAAREYSVRALPLRRLRRRRQQAFQRGVRLRGVFRGFHRFTLRGARVGDARSCQKRVRLSFRRVSSKRVAFRRQRRRDGVPASRQIDVRADRLAQTLHLADRLRLLLLERGTRHPRLLRRRLRLERGGGETRRLRLGVLGDRRELGLERVARRVRRRQSALERLARRLRFVESGARLHRLRGGGRRCALCILQTLFQRRRAFLAILQRTAYRDQVFLGVRRLRRRLRRRRLRRVARRLRLRLGFDARLRRLLLGARRHLKSLGEPFRNTGVPRLELGELRARGARRRATPPRLGKIKVAARDDVGDAAAQLRRRPRAARLGGGGEELIRKRVRVFVFRVGTRGGTRGAGNAVVQGASGGRRERSRRKRGEVGRGGEGNVFVLVVLLLLLLAELGVRPAVVRVVRVDASRRARERRRHRRVQRGQNARESLTRFRFPRGRLLQRLGSRRGFPPRRRSRVGPRRLRQARRRVVASLQRRRGLFFRVRHPRERRLLAPSRLLGLGGGRRDGALERLESASQDAFARRRVGDGDAQFANAFFFRLQRLRRRPRRLFERFHLERQRIRRREARLQTRFGLEKFRARLLKRAFGRFERRRRGLRVAPRRLHLETHRLRRRRRRLRRRRAFS